MSRRAGLLVGFIVVVVASASHGSTAGSKADAPAKSVPVLTEAQQKKHNDLFKRGGDLINPYMRITDRPSKEASKASRDLREGIRLLDEALKLYPGNWAALWVQGKAFQ